MHELAPLIYDLAIMLGLAGIVIILFQRIHQPVVLGYLVAGIIIGPYTPPHSWVSDITNIQILSELGVIFLMFSLGLEFSFQKLTRVGFSAAVTGFLEVILMIMIGYGTGILMGWSQYDSMFLGAALSISSTTIIIKAIEELGLKAHHFAELIFGVLIVEDLLAILLLVALSTVAVTKNIVSFEMVSATYKLVLVVGGWFLIGYFLVPPLFRKIGGYMNQETLTIVSVALCLFLVCVAAKFHYSVALGAFIMGSILAETIVIRRIERLIKPIRDIFAAVFFIAVGMLIDPAVIIEYWPMVIVISLVTVFGKILTTSMAALLSGQKIETSVRVGFGMAQVGEFSFIIAALGVALNVTTNKLYPIIVAVSGITTFTTPYLIRLSGPVSTFIEDNLSDPIKTFLYRYYAKLNKGNKVSKRDVLYQQVAIRMIVNGILVAIIFSLINYFLFPDLSWITDTLCLFIALALSSPFIWGMLFSYKKIAPAIENKANLKFIMALVWAMTCTEIITLGLVYFNAWTTIALFVLIAIVYYFISDNTLEKAYHWFETRLVNNIKKGTDDKKSNYKKNKLE